VRAERAEVSATRRSVSRDPGAAAGRAFPAAHAASGDVPARRDFDRADRDAAHGRPTSTPCRGDAPSPAPVIPQDPPGANAPDSGVPVTAAALVPPACQARMFSQRRCRRDHPGTRCQRKRLRRACKPDSVQGRAPWATIPLDEPLPARSSCQPGPLGRSHPATEAARGPYSALLPVGLAVPVRLPVPRWALTPPFHPYLRNPDKPCAEGGLFSVALSVGLPRPGVTRHRRFVKSGLSSAPEMNPVPRPPGPPQKALRRPAPPRSSPARQGPAARVAPSRTGHPGRACAPARSLHGRSLPRARCPSAP